MEVEPFRTEPDPRFYFKSRSQEHARIRLVRAIEQRKSLSIFIGEPGCGKTTLARHVLASLDPESYVAHLLAPVHSSVDAGWLLRRIARAYGVKAPRTTPIQILGQIHSRLVQMHDEGKLPILLFDEAQMLRDRALLEEFRALLNLERKGQKMLSLILFGMGQLDEVLRLDPALAQRVEIRVRLGALETDEVSSYVHHRLECASGPREVFTEEAIQAIALYSKGTPRIVNTLADNALFEGFMSRANPIDASVIQAVAGELGLADECAAEEDPETVSLFDDPGESPPPVDEPVPEGERSAGLGLLEPSDVEGQQRGSATESSPSRSKRPTEEAEDASAEGVEVEVDLDLDAASCTGTQEAGSGGSESPEEEDIDSMFDGIQVPER